MSSSYTTARKSAGANPQPAEAGELGAEPESAQGSEQHIGAPPAKETKDLPLSRPLYCLFAHLCDCLSGSSKRRGGDDADGPAPISGGVQLVVRYLNHAIGHLETKQEQNTAGDPRTRSERVHVHSPSPVVFRLQPRV